MKQIITASLITLFLLPILFLSGCDKKQQKLSKTEKAGNSIRHTFKPKTDLPSSQKKQLEKDSASFENIKKDSESFADKIKGFFDLGNPYMITSNTIDNVKEFVKSKTEKELLNYLYEARGSEPFAAKQVTEYILKNTTNNKFYAKIAADYQDVILFVGSEADLPMALDTFDQLIKIHERGEVLNQSDRIKLINALNGFCFIFDDLEMYKQLVKTIRQYASSDLEESFADLYDIHIKSEENTLESYIEAKELLKRIYKRNNFGPGLISKEHVDRNMKLIEEDLIKFRKGETPEIREKKHRLGILIHGINKTPEEIMRELAEAQAKAK